METRFGAVRTAMMCAPRRGGFPDPGLVDRFLCFFDSLPYQNNRSFIGEPATAQTRSGANASDPPFFL